jgi:hypothetical protein
MIARLLNLLFAVTIARTHGFTTESHLHARRSVNPRRFLSDTSANRVPSDTSDPVDQNPLTKASWYAVEAFGQLFGSNKKKTQQSEEQLVYSLDQAPSSLRETLQRIQADNDRQYFLSGNIDELIYDENCIFSDPFVSFQGRDRFVQNLANLGSFITEYSAKPIQYDESTEDAAVTTKFMVKLRLNLPWKPVLAWPWGVRCEIDPETNLIIQHKESWDIEPLEGVKQIFRKPTTSV